MASAYEEAVAIMRRFPEKMHFAGPRPAALIEKAQKALGLTFPPDFRRFVTDFGAGNFGAFEVYGVTTDNFSSASVPNGIWVTLSERSQSGLPNNFVVIGDDGGGGLYCLSCASPDDLSCPVFLYFPESPSGTSSPEPIARDFGSYLVDGVRRACL